MFRNCSGSLVYVLLHLLVYCCLVLMLLRGIGFLFCSPYFLGYVLLVYLLVFGSMVSVLLAIVRVPH